MKQVAKTLTAILLAGALSACQSKGTYVTSDDKNIYEFKGRFGRDSVYYREVKADRGEKISLSVIKTDNTVIRYVDNDPIKEGLDYIEVNVPNQGLIRYERNSMLGEEIIKKQQKEFDSYLREINKPRIKEAESYFR